MKKHLIKKITHTSNGLLIILLFLSACSGDSGKTSVPSSDDTNIIDTRNSGTLTLPTENLALTDNRFSDVYQVLIFGNSHTLGLGSLIKTLLSTVKPHAKISVVNEGLGFLDDFLYEKVHLLENNSWTHVILQGQKYSQSGAFTYPTTAAQILIDKAKKNETTPILFPEHPQRGNPREGRRVHSIHTAIAAMQSSCVAPIGLAWDKVINIDPQLVLHSNDGNHAAFLGKLLTAYLFYEVITGQAADLLPFIEEIKVEEATQHFLKQLASETIQFNQPCIFAG